jgi:hypothetical protein
MVSQTALKNFRSYMAANAASPTHAFDSPPSPRRGSRNGIPLRSFEKGGVHDELNSASATVQKLVEFPKVNLPPAAIAGVRGLVQSVVDSIEGDEPDESANVAAAGRWTKAPDLPHADRLGRPFEMGRRR